jgi:hypothetical protein
MSEPASTAPKTSTRFNRCRYGDCSHGQDAPVYYGGYRPAYFGGYGPTPAATNCVFEDGWRRVHPGKKRWCALGRMIVIEQFRFYGDFPVDRCAHNDLVAGPGQAEANPLIGRPRRSRVCRQFPISYQRIPFNQT